MCHGSFMNTYLMLFSHLFELFLGSLVPVMCTSYQHYISPLHHAAKWMSRYNAIMVTTGKTHCFYNKQYIYRERDTHTHICTVYKGLTSPHRCCIMSFFQLNEMTKSSQDFLFFLTFKAFVMFMTFYYFKVTYM